MPRRKTDQTNTNRKKLLVTLLVILILIGAGIGIWLWTRPAPKPAPAVERSEPEQPAAIQPGTSAPKAVQPQTPAMQPPEKAAVKTNTGGLSKPARKMPVKQPPTITQKIPETKPEAPVKNMPAEQPPSIAQKTLTPQPSAPVKKTPAKKPVIIAQQVPEAKPAAPVKNIPDEQPLSIAPKTPIPQLSTPVKKTPAKKPVILAQKVPATKPAAPSPVQEATPPKLSTSDIFPDRGQPAQTQAAAEPPQKPEPIRMQVKQQRVIDYNRIDTDPELKALTEKRKKAYGVEKGVDIIVKSDEALKVGDVTVPMQEILDEIKLKEGSVVEKDITPPASTPQTVAKAEAPTPNPAAASPAPAQPLPPKQSITGGTRIKVVIPKKPVRPQPGVKAATSQKSPSPIAETPQPEKEFGIHVVRPGENIWNLHFQLLRDYFSRRNIRVSLRADEPDRRGHSSGIGKILKFSEKLVYIYNLREKRLDVHLDLIQPLDKIVIYNMGRVFKLLDQIDYTNIRSIEFDGETIWLPAEQ